MRRLELSSSSPWDLTIAQALFQPQSRELLLFLTWFQGVVAVNHVLHTPTRDYSLMFVACLSFSTVSSSLCFVIIIIELPRNALTRNAGDLESALVPRVSGRVSSHAIGSMSGS